MKNEFPDELISAYLDGEVTADEQAQVEQALHDNAEYQHLFDELRTLRSSLQSLPRCQLDATFSERVLRRAERAMLEPAAVSDSGDGAVKHSTDGRAHPASRPKRRMLSKRWYAAIGISAAIAAVLVVALFIMPKGPDPNTVKKDDSPDKKSAVVDALKNQPDNPVTSNRAEGEGRNNDKNSEVFPDTSPKTKQPADGNGQDKQAHIEDMVQKSIARLDRDNDGLISEHEAADDKLIKDVFDQTDKDANGKLDADEIYEYLKATLPTRK